MCIPDETLDCVDGNECTEDLCVAQSGCSNPPLPEGTECNGGNGWACHGGSCVQGSADLVLYYDFEEGQGTVFDHGVSGNQTNGTLNGNVSFHGDGKYGDYSLRSHGGSNHNDRLQISGNVTDLDMSGPYSLMAWVKVIGGSGGQGIIVLGACCTPRQGYSLTIEGSNTLRLWAGSAKDDENYNTTGGTQLNDGQWHHVGARVNMNSSQVLVDGQVDGTFNKSNIPTNPSMANPDTDYNKNNPNIGGDGIHGTGYDVLIDEVRVYKAYLDGDDWTKAMNGQF